MEAAYDIPPINGFFLPYEYRNYEAQGRQQLHTNITITQFLILKKNQKRHTGNNRMRILLLLTLQYDAHPSTGLASRDRGQDR